MKGGGEVGTTRIRSRRALYVRDTRDEILPWLESIAQDQRRHHPGTPATAASVARELLVALREYPEIERKFRR